MERTDRRTFIAKTSATMAGALGVPYTIPASAFGADGTVAPSNRITLGFVGVGLHGLGRNVRGMMAQPDTQVLAVCDVDQNHRDFARNLVNDTYGTKDCAAYNDFRDLIARDDIDAVVVSTPDHWHVLPSIAAAKAGKDVLCEKPVSLTVQEGRVLSDTMRRYGRIFQTATPNRANQSSLYACELVRNGRLGTLQTIYAFLPGGHDYRRMFSHGHLGQVRPAPKIHPPEPVPQGFDYDMWLGPAPEAPYTPGRCHWNYRWILDYSGGQLTDRGAHVLGMAQLANATEFGGPVSVEGRGLFPADGLYNTATEWEITYEYANGVKMICMNGASGFRFEGTDGWLSSTYGVLECSSPEILNSGLGPDDIHLRTCRQGELRDFLNCVKNRQQPYAPAEVGHRTASVCHLGNIAMLLGRKLQWDPAGEQFINDDRANAMLWRPMRGPWHL